MITAGDRKHLVPMNAISPGPGGFRLNFIKSRPSPRPEREIRQAERANTTSTTDFEDLGSSTILSPSSSNDAEYKKPPISLANLSDSNRFIDPTDEGLEEDERELLLEENTHWAGELERMSAFTTFIGCIRTTFATNNQERRQKMEALFDIQNAESTKNEELRQANFAQDLEKFSLEAQDSHVLRDVDRIANETARAELLEQSRGRRAAAKETAETELEQLADNLREEQRQGFERETLKMDATIAKLVEQAQKELKMLTLVSELQGSQMQTEPGIHSNKKVTDGSDTIHPALTMVVPSPSWYSYPHSRRSSRSSRSYRPAQPTIIPGPPIMHPTPSALPHSPPPPAFPDNCDGNEHNPRIRIPSPDVFVHDDAGLLKRSQMKWLEDERARNEGEAKRQGVFSSTLRTLQDQFLADLEDLGNRGRLLTSSMADPEKKREQEFDSFMKSARARFDSFKLSIGKKFDLLRALEEEYDEELKEAMRDIEGRGKKDLEQREKKLRKHFQALQEERRQRLSEALEELLKVRCRRQSSSPPACIPVPIAGMPMSGMPMPGMIPTMPLSCMPPVVMARSSSRSSRSRSRSPRRSYSPPTGFAPQALFKMQTLSTRPNPRPSIQPPPAKSAGLITMQYERPSLQQLQEQRRILFAVNEARRQTAFEEAQIDRQFLFDTAEFERDSTFRKKLEEQGRRFLEAEAQRKVEFTENSRSRSDRFLREQKQMAEDYHTMETSLLQKCTSRGRERVRDMKKWMDKFVGHASDRWKELVQKEAMDRQLSFQSMVREVERNLTCA